MRIVQLPGPKARYARLTMMDKLPERGLAPDAATTSPFTLAVQNGKAVILIDQTRVAVVDAAGPHLIVREQYPERFDPALIRAVRAVSELVEEMNGSLKEEAGTMARLITKERPQDFRIAASPEEMGKALLALEVMEPRITASREGETDLLLRIRVNKTFSQASVKRHGDEYEVTQNRYAEYSTYLREEAFRAAFERGTRIWEERFCEERFLANLAGVAPLGDVDKFTVNTIFEEGSAPAALRPREPSRMARSR